MTTAAYIPTSRITFENAADATIFCNFFKSIREAWLEVVPWGLSEVMIRAFHQRDCDDTVDLPIMEFFENHPEVNASGAVQVDYPNWGASDFFEFEYRNHHMQGDYYSVDGEDEDALHSRIDERL